MFGDMNFMIYTGALGMVVGVILLVVSMTRKEKPQTPIRDDGTPAWIRKKEKAKRKAKKK